MRAEVRDDIISLNSFVEAKFKYEKYLELLRQAGNYCFLDQFKKHIDKSRYILEGMEQANLIKTGTLNNNFKYIYLTDTAMKYLCLKNDEKDYSNISKKSINVKKVTKYPSEKVLMGSAMKFELIVNGKNKIVTKEGLIDSWRNKLIGKSNLEDLEDKKEKLANEFERIKKEYELVNKEFNGVTKDISNRPSEYVSLKNDNLSNINNLENEIEELGVFSAKKKEEKIAQIECLKSENELLDIKISIKKAIETTLLKYSKQLKELKEQHSHVCTQIQKLKSLIIQREEESKKVIDKVLSYYDKTKLIICLVKNKLNVLILDTGNTKKAYSYLKIINEIEKEVNKIVKTEGIEMFFFSYSSKRAAALKLEFEETQKKREHALDTMSAYEAKYSLKREYRGQWTYDPPQHYNVAENVFYNTPKVNLDTPSTMFYMEKYKKNLSLSDNYIKESDLKTINELKQKLNS